MTTRPNMIGEADAVLVTVAAPTKPRPVVGTSSPSMAPHPVRGRHPGWRPTTESLLDRVPVGNLRVPRAEFGALRVEAERLNAEQAGQAEPD
jgi:hypothetical protein